MAKEKFDISGHEVILMGSDFHIMDLILMGLDISQTGISYKSDLMFLEI